MCSSAATLDPSLRNWPSVPQRIQRNTGWVDSRVVLACEGGLAGALRSGLLGGYDGAGSWRIFVERVSGKDEHLVVQVHEAMHHELQTSTLWGSLTAMSAVLAAGGWSS